MTTSKETGEKQAMVPSARKTYNLWPPVAGEGKRMIRIDFTSNWLKGQPIFSSIATYWVPDLPNIKGISGHLSRLIFIFANGASHTLSNKHINMLA